MQLNTYLIFNKVKDNKKTAFAFTFMRGKAHYWLKPHFKEWYANKRDISGMVRNFNRFKRESNKYFRSTNNQQIAERTIQNLRQKGLASDYATIF